MLWSLRHQKCFPNQIFKNKILLDVLKSPGCFCWLKATWLILLTSFLVKESKNFLSTRDRKRSTLSFQFRISVSSWAEAEARKHFSISVHREVHRGQAAAALAVPLQCCHYSFIACPSSSRHNLNRGIAHDRKQWAWFVNPHRLCNFISVMGLYFKSPLLCSLHI